MRCWLAVSFLALVVQSAAAHEAAPTEGSIRQLFQVMHTSALLDAYVAQMDQTVHASMRQSVQGATLNAEEQQILDDMSGEMIEMLRQELNWASLEPLMIAVYRRSFTQQEVDGMLKFYGSPLGQSVITKQPLAMQQMVQAMQQRVSALQSRVAQLQSETAAALKRAADRAAAATSQPPPQPPPDAPAQPASH
jgi:uncharacterized protein